MGVGQVYRKTTENITANYDFFDLASKTGYKRFYAIVNGSSENLVTTTIDGNSWRITTATGGTPIQTYNFDLSFKAPTIIKGSAMVAATVEAYGGTSGATTSANVKVTIKKVNKSNVVSTISSQQTSDSVSVSGTTTASRRVGLTFTIPRTHFAINEKLRLEVEFHGSSGSGTGLQAMRLYFDPANRGTISNETYTGASPATNLLIDVPFEVDI